MRVSAPGGLVLGLDYAVTGNIAALAVPVPAPPERRDNLWQATCFELFVQLGGDAYAEFNFSPSTCWAAYGFDDYRTGMRSLSGVEPRIEVSMGEGRLDLRVEIDLALLVRDFDRAIGLSAVIEQADGAKSWWALAHPAGKPDFHHRDCFALQLGAARGA